MSKKVRVLVLSGGFSNEREVSLKSGAQVAKALQTLPQLEVTRVEISKDGRWTLPAQKAKGSTSHALAVMDSKQGLSRGDMRSYDVAFIAMHGKFGEDGKIQAILETTGIPYTGSGVLASALAMNKAKTYEVVRSAGIAVPDFLEVTRYDEIKKVLAAVQKKIGIPCVVKPNESGSSVGISIVKKKEQLLPATKKAFKEDRSILIQKFIKGRELTCGVMGNSGETEILPLPPVEIVPEGHEFFDYKAKYTSKTTQEICPARIPAGLTKKVQRLSVAAHVALGCDGLTRSDFILASSGKLYFLETNTIPGLTEASLCPKEAVAMGWPFAQFLKKQVDLALRKRR